MIITGSHMSHDYELRIIMYYYYTILLLLLLLLLLLSLLLLLLLLWIYIALVFGQTNKNTKGGEIKIVTYLLMANIKYV